MKRSIVLAGIILALLSGGIYAYYQLGGSPETRRERHLKRAKDYLQESKVNEALVELRNAVKADPRSAEARQALANVLFKKGDLKNGYAELVRAVDLKPDDVKGRYQLGMLQLRGKQVARAKEQLEKLREQDRNAFETRHLASQIAWAERDGNRAVAELNELIKNNPNNARAYVEIGWIHYADKNLKLAEESFRKAIEADPKSPGSRIALAQLYVRSGEQRRAEEELILATKEDPENEALLNVLGNFYSTTDQFDDVERIFQDLLKKKPNSTIAKKRLVEIYVTKNDLNRSKPLITEILKANSDDVDGRFYRGRVFLAEKKFTEAYEDLSFATRLSPQFAAGHFFLGIASASLSKIVDAKKSYTRATELAPNWVLPHITLAQLYLVSGEHDFALAEADKVLKLQNNNLAALLVVAGSRLAKGELEKSLVIYKAIQTAQPNNEPAAFNLGSIYRLQKKYAQAIEEFEKVLRRNPEHVEALIGIARSEVFRGNSKAALERVQGQLGVTKRQAPAYELLGQLQLAAKAYPDAIASLEKAIALEPDRSSVYYLLGSAYVEQKQFDAAIDQYQTLIKKSPNLVPPHMMTAILYELKKDTAKANYYYQKILDINKRFAPAANNLAWNFAEHGGNLDVALGLAQRAREVSPNDAVIADTLGWIYYKKGAYGSAISLLKESNEKFMRKNPSVLYHLGLAYQKNKEKELAKQALIQALNVGQEFSEMAEAKQALESLK